MRLILEPLCRYFDQLITMNVIMSIMVGDKMNALIEWHDVDDSDDNEHGEYLLRCFYDDVFF